MDEEHCMWLQRNHHHLARNMPAEAMLGELASTYVFVQGSEEYSRIALSDEYTQSEALLRELCGKSTNAFLYFIRAVRKVCPDLLTGCEPAEDTQRYVVEVLNDSDKAALIAALKELVQYNTRELDRNISSSSSSS
eukprot:scpid101236/ scgid15564/ 